MTTKNYPTDTAEQARGVVEAWKEIDPALQIGGLPLSTLEADLTQAMALYAQIDSLEAQFIDLRNRRDVHVASLWEEVKRVRAGVKALFGDDSSQYEMMGGTRMSERKLPSRSKETA